MRLCEPIPSRTTVPSVAGSVLLFSMNAVNVETLIEARITCDRCGTLLESRGQP